MPSQSDLEPIVQTALRQLRLNDEFLLRRGQERAAVHRLAVYLEHSFFGWDVDVDYNREGSKDSQKHLSVGRVGIPDIIIHQRGQNSIFDNLLIIEVKIKKLSEDDTFKLSDFTKRPAGLRKFQYQFGLGIGNLADTQPSVTWYQSGETIAGTHSE